VQHGFLGTGGWYSNLAIALAEGTNSVVVVPVHGLDQRHVRRAGPTSPIYGVYGPTGGYLPPGGQQIILGLATGTILPV
jgi:hypothetical protein